MAYSNRTDLNNPAQKIARTAATGQAYGKATEQLNAQKAVPMGASPADAAPATGPSVAPGGLGMFSRPTDVPAEPPTAGVNFGPGPSMRDAGLPVVPTPQDNTLLELQAIYKMFPEDNDLADMLDRYIREGR